MARPRLKDDDIRVDKFKAKIPKEHAYKYLQEIGQYIADRGYDAIWDLKYKLRSPTIITIDIRIAGVAGQLERYVQSLVDRDSE